MWSSLGGMITCIRIVCLGTYSEKLTAKLDGKGVAETMRYESAHVSSEPFLMAHGRVTS